MKTPQRLKPKIMKNLTEHERNIYIEGVKQGESFKFIKIITYLMFGILGGLILGYFIN